MSHNYHSQPRQSTTGDASSRISFVHNPSTPTDTKTPPERGTSVSALFSHLIANERLGSLTPALLLHALKLHVPSDADNAQAQEAFSFDEALSQVMGDISLSAIDVSNYTSYTSSSRLLVKKLDVAPGANTILINGRIVGPFDAADFGPGDFEDLEQYEGGKRVVPVLAALGDVWEGLEKLDEYVSPFLRLESEEDLRLTVLRAVARSRRSYPMWYQSCPMCASRIRLRRDCTTRSSRRAIRTIAGSSPSTRTSFPSPIRAHYVRG